ncbi:MAG: hypothetical protein RLY16_2783 [Bacteroidota bacterium]|jgi:hypothetical protein
MQSIYNPLLNQIESLIQLLDKLTQEQYIQPIAIIGDASIGEHTRHIIEVLSCTLQGYAAGSINYFDRRRNLNFEQDIKFARTELKKILFSTYRPDKPMQVNAKTTTDETAIVIHSTYFRELLFITDHTLHHLAFINVALKSMSLNLVNENFGLSYSTIAYKQQMQQSDN